MTKSYEGLLKTWFPSATRSSSPPMGAVNWIALLLTHPFEFRTLIQLWLYYEQKRDIAALKEHPTSGWDRASMRRCWEFLDMTSRSFSAVIKELEGDLARTVSTRAFYTSSFGVGGPGDVGFIYIMDGIPPYYLTSLLWNTRLCFSHVASATRGGHIRPSTKRRAKGESWNLIPSVFHFHWGLVLNFSIQFDGARRVFFSF